MLFADILIKINSSEVHRISAGWKICVICAKDHHGLSRRSSVSLRAEILAFASNFERMPAAALLDLLGIAAELLAQRHWRCILSVSTADLDNVVEARCVIQEGGQEPSQAYIGGVMNLQLC